MIRITDEGEREKLQPSSTERNILIYVHMKQFTSPILLHSSKQ